VLPSSFLSKGGIPIITLLSQIRQHRYRIGYVPLFGRVHLSLLLGIAAAAALLSALCRRGRISGRTVRLALGFGLAGNELMSSAWDLCSPCSPPVRPGPGIDAAPRRPERTKAETGGF
jgi:hypothetical protein